MAYVLDDLPYDYAALEPVLDAETMRLHHDKHHQTYVDKLNDALQGSPELSAQPVESLLRDLGAIPGGQRMAVRNHGGGHANHRLFWESLAPADSTAPSAELVAALTEHFGGLEPFKKAFTEAALARFGSGWAWLVRNVAGKMTVLSTANQDTPLSDGLTPLLLVDVWEHAYYLKYQNRRAEYLEQWWRVVDWTKVAERWAGASAI